MRFEVDNLGSVGLVKDVFSHDTPPEAWTALQNARMGPFGAERFLGHVRALGTGTAGWAVAPYWLLFTPVAGADDLWVGAGQQKVYCRSAKSPYTETNITRQSGGVDVNYAADETRKWNGDMFGGLLVLNNGNDEPQAWVSPAAATKLVNLSATAAGADAWPTNYRARCMRAFGRFLVGIDITKGATRYPQLIKWSHPADPGAMPSSWDPTNAAKDAGEYPLSSAKGDLVDMLPLRNSNIIYSTGDAWAMNYIGGNNIFGFTTALKEQGALYTGCVAGFKKESEFHAVLSGDDVYVHNGQAIRSIMTPKLRRWFFSQIDPTNYQRSFVVTNPVYSEVWVCIPQLGAEQPTLALVWNWDTDAIGFRDLLVATSNADTRTTAGTKGTPCIAQGLVDDVTSEPWSGDPAAWDSDTTVWDARTASPVVERLFMQDRSAGVRTFMLDSGADFDTASYQFTLERVGLSTLGRDRQGNPKVDAKIHKLLTEVWPRVEAPLGTVITVNIGTQKRPEDAVYWSADYNFTVGTDEFIPVYHSEKYLSIRFSFNGTSSVRILGYGLEISAAGQL